MLTKPMDILTTFPVRKSKKQKQEFRDAVQAYVKELGYESVIEQGCFGCRNLVIGDPENAKYLVTAHYDTPAALPFPNLITPCSFLPYLAYQILLILSIILFAFVPEILFLLAFDISARTATGIYSISFYTILALMLIGPANRSNSNDNTSGVVTLLEIARSMPENQRDKVCFVLFDLEEAGLIGSTSYRKKHKEASNGQIVLNLDCVGDGNHIMMFPTKAMKKDRKKLTSLYKACGYFGAKSVTVREKGFAAYPSDQKNFPYGVGICALKQSKFGLYLGRIHTPKDTILEETNVNILRAAITTYICCDAAQ